MRKLRSVYRMLVMLFGAGCLAFWIYQTVIKLLSGNLAAKIGALLPYFS